MDDLGIALILFLSVMGLINVAILIALGYPKTKSQILKEELIEFLKNIQPESSPLLKKLKEKNIK